MLPGMLFATWRFFELITLIPTLGMLSYFVNLHTKANQLTPASILVLFIVSVLAAFWALATLLAYGLTKWNARFCAIVDLLFVGAFIAGVYYLRGVTHWDCTSGSYPAGSSLTLGPVAFGGSITVPSVNKTCAMLKASFAFGIMNIIFFFITFLILLWIAREHVDHYRGGSRTVRREYVTRSHHSRSPRRSHHSSRRYSRTYV